MNSFIRLPAAVLLGLAGCASERPGDVQFSAGDQERRSRPEVPYVPTPPDVVEAMIRAAGVGPQDVVYDLGCGDGRIVVAAAKEGARAVGVDIDPRRIAEARENAARAGVEARATFVEQDLFETDLRAATVVMIYLLPDVNRRLRAKLLRELKPGARVVSHRFDMGDWKPERTLRVGGRTVYLWRIPPAER